MRLLLTISLALMLPIIALGQRGNLTRAQIKEAEQRLSELGYWTGPIDGALDAGSRQASPRVTAASASQCSPRSKPAK